MTKINFKAHVEIEFQDFFSLVQRTLLESIPSLNHEDKLVNLSLDEGKIHLWFERERQS